MKLGLGGTLKLGRLKKFLSNGIKPLFNKLKFEGELLWHC